MITAVGYEEVLAFMGRSSLKNAASFRLFSLLAFERRRRSLSQQSSCKGSACEAGS